MFFEYGWYVNAKYHEFFVKLKRSKWNPTIGLKMPSENAVGQPQLQS